MQERRTRSNKASEICEPGIAHVVRVRNGVTSGNSIGDGSMSNMWRRNSAAASNGTVRCLQFVESGFGNSGISPGIKSELGDGEGEAEIPLLRREQPCLAERSGKLLHSCGALADAEVRLEDHGALDVLVGSQMLVVHGKVQVVGVPKVVTDGGVGSGVNENEVEGLLSVRAKQDRHDGGLTQLHIGSEAANTKFSQSNPGD